ncbi:branched-chain amino acid transport system substrate-binding protein [Frankia sp. AiPs1]|uniref:branched-chain amino acid ABC transporter substrate-binding protein n=1 Tax=Frankia sp. AiPa1 TaxID=573492 RepID=UPI00202B1231|nr:branched-chain amino acid ABC transporter substrate-binding protein [Frankia sp. AiPa1]MCL9761371.1 branched-chain amino acid ABC transporter substrate-binding protein [Frankia sp. AiPa1]
MTSPVARAKARVRATLRTEIGVLRGWLGVSGRRLRGLPGRLRGLAAGVGVRGGQLGRWVHARARSGRGRVLLALLGVVVLAVPSLLGFALATLLGGGDAGGPGGVGTRVATIGVMAPLSGDLSTAGTAVRNAVALAIDEANESGAVPGWRLELSSRDDLARPDGGAQAADTFAANDRLIAVVGPVSSLVARVAVPTLAATGIAVVSPSNADPVLTGLDAEPRTRPYPSYFRLSGTDDLQAQVAAEYAVHTLGRRHIAIVDGEPRYGETLADRFATRAIALGASVTARYPVAAGESDDTEVEEIAASLEREAPNLVYLDADATFAGKLRARLAEGRMTAQILGSDALLNPRYPDEAKSADYGDLITSLLTPPTRLPAAGAFVAAYAQHFGGPTADDSGADGARSATVGSGGSGGGGTSRGASAGGSGSGSARSADRPAGAGSSASATSDGDGAPAPKPAASAVENSTRPDAGRQTRGGDAATSTAGTHNQADHDAAVQLAQRQAEAVPAVAAYAYDAARAIIRAAATVLPGRPGVDAAARRDLVTAIGRATFVGVSGTIAFDRFGDIRAPSVVLYTVLGDRFVALTSRTH